MKYSTKIGAACGIMMLVNLCSCGKQEEKPCELVNLLPQFAQTDDVMLYDYYAEEIAECKAMGTDAYCVEKVCYDLDGDGTEETLSFFMSSIHNGSLGNVEVDIFDGKTQIGENLYMELNPHLDENALHADYTTYLWVLPQDSNGYADLEYRIIAEEDNSLIYSNIFQYDGKVYS